MSDKDERSATRRNVIKTVAGAGVAGLAARPAAAASEDVTFGPLADVSADEKLSFPEYRRVLGSEDNGAVRRTAGSVREEVKLVGDDREVRVDTMQRRFEGGLSAEDTVKECFDPGFLVPEFCAELTVDVTETGVEVLVVVAGYPIVDTTLPLPDVELPDGRSVSYDFDVPLVEISGSVTLSYEKVDSCTVTLSADASLDAFGDNFEFDESVTESFC
jgi:hypothetical protein